MDTSPLNETPVEVSRDRAGPLEPGVYYLRNVVSGTVLSLGKDKKSVVGHSLYEGRDQKWELGRLGERGWFIRSLYSRNNHYMTIKDGVWNWASIAVNEFPVAWSINNEPKEGDDVIWIHWPNYKWTVDLHWAGKKDGTMVHIWERHGERHQHWKLIPCQDDDQMSTSLLQSGNTRTTVTTAVTTVTTTTKTVATKDEMGREYHEEGNLRD